tara:strand:- start:2152 stop:2595 length:444 start_codon:yes stop_codon:yes gene_type:complete
MKDEESESIQNIAKKNMGPRYAQSKLSESPELGTPGKKSDSPNPMMTPDDTPPVKTEKRGLVSSSSGRNLMDDFNELDVLKGELEELRKQLTQCRTDLEESKFTNKAKKLFSCGRAGLKPKKSGRKKKTKKRKHTKKRKTRRKTKKR